jgi:hypothetical protein
MVKGDPGVEDIYRWKSTQDMAVPMRGANGRSDGSHIMTGAPQVPPLLRLVTLLLVGRGSGTSRGRCCQLSVLAAQLVGR